MSKGKKDLFDFLGISTREDSYTTLIAALFEENPRWAQTYFEGTLCLDPPDGPVRMNTQLHVPREEGRKADRLDLVLTFGRPVTDIWLIEAKIKSGESSDQLQRYGKDEDAQRRILEGLDFLKDTEPEKVRWHCSYLTLEGEKPTKPTEFQPITYEPLCRILASPDPSSEILPAHRCLHNRLTSYYRTRANVLEGATPSRERTLKVYLHDTQGVIDEANKFYWLTRQSVEAMKLRFTFGKTSQGNPFCQLRADHWQGKYYKKGKVQLRDCFDIHLELQCSDGEVRFRLHFETNPYIPKLKDKVSPTEFEEHRKQSEDFAEEVANHKEEYRNKLSSTDWRFTKQYANQRATCGNFKLDRNVGDYCRWVETGTQAIVPLIECAGKEADLWK